MWQKATKTDYAMKYETPDQKEMILYELGSGASQAFVPSAWASYQQGERNEI